MKELGCFDISDQLDHGHGREVQRHRIRSYILALVSFEYKHQKLSRVYGQVRYGHRRN